MKFEQSEKKEWVMVNTTTHFILFCFLMSHNLPFFYPNFRCPAVSSFYAKAALT